MRTNRKSLTFKGVLAHKTYKYWHLSLNPTSPSAQRACVKCAKICPLQTSASTLICPVRHARLPDASELQDPGWSWFWTGRQKPWSAGKQQVQFCLTHTVISSVLKRRGRQSPPLKSEWDSSGNGGVGVKSTLSPKGTIPSNQTVPRSRGPFAQVTRLSFGAQLCAKATDFSAGKVINETINTLNKIQACIILCRVHIASSTSSGYNGLLPCGERSSSWERNGNGWCRHAWLKLSHNPLVPKTHLCQGLERVFPSAPMIHLRVIFLELWIPECELPD